jgi:hypothetical protein
MTSTSNPPPNWYPDPAGPGSWRWWDGQQWSPHTAPMAPNAPLTTMPTGAYMGSSVAVLSFAERRLAVWARLAAIVFPLYSASSALVNAAYADRWHRYFHQLQLAANNPALPQPSLSLPAFTALAPLNLLALAFGVITLVWQHHAATTARALGYPARRTPGWGVAFWFIPIVNLWMPYQALRDCLPPDHPARRTLLTGWLCYTLLVPVWVAGFAICIFGSNIDLGRSLMLVDVPTQLVVLFCGFRFIGAVTHDHQRAVSGTAAT